jgi:hypothetical protein
MPRRARVPKARLDVLDWQQASALCVGGEGPVIEVFGSLDAAGEAWEANRDWLMRWGNAGTRPWWWWQFESPLLAVPEDQYAALDTLGLLDLDEFDTPAQRQYRDAAAKADARA